MNLLFWRKREREMGDSDDESPDDASGVDSEASGPSSHVLKHGAHTFAAGLQWSGLNGGEAVAIKRAGRDHSYFVGSTLASGSPTLGLADRSAEGVPVAGALLGALYPEALIFTKLPGTDLYWVCFITDGLPSPGFDGVYADKAEAQKWYSEAYQYVGSVSFTRIGDGPSDRYKLDAALDAAIAHAVGDAASPKAINAALSKYRLKAKRFNWLRFSLSLTGLLLVVGLAAAGYLYREQLSSRRAAQALLADQLRSSEAQAAEQARLQRLRAQFDAELAAERQKFGRANVAMAQWQACNRLRTGLPISMYGYVVRKLECDFASGSATVEWSPTSPAVRLADRAALPGIVDKYEPSNPAVSRFDLDLAVTGTPAVAMKAEAVRMAVLDWAGIRMRSLQMGSFSPLVMTPPKDLEGVTGMESARIGERAEISFTASGAMDVLMAEPAIRMLDSFAVDLRKVEWRDPALGKASVAVTAVLHLPS